MKLNYAIIIIERRFPIPEIRIYARFEYQVNRHRKGLSFDWGKANQFKAQWFIIGARNYGSLNYSNYYNLPRLLLIKVHEKEVKRKWEEAGVCDREARKEKKQMLLEGFLARFVLHFLSKIPRHCKDLSWNRWWQFIPTIKQIGRRGVPISWSITC